MASTVSRQISLAGQKPLRHGAECYVFQHPDQPDQLLKVLRPDGSSVLRAQRGRLKRPMLRLFGAFASWHLEYSEYMMAMSRHGALPAFVPSLVGFCTTDLGPAMVVEKICGPDGALAPTLADLAISGRFDAGIEELVDQFFDDLTASGIITRDLNPGNLVLAEDPRRLMLVEGMGCRSLLPTRRLSARLRKGSQDRHRAQLMGRIRVLQTDPESLPIGRAALRERERDAARAEVAPVGLPEGQLSGPLNG